MMIVLMAMEVSLEVVAANISPVDIGDHQLSMEQG